VSQFSRRLARIFRPGGRTPIVTWSIIALCIVAWALQFLLAPAFTNLLAYWPPATTVLPWTMVTYAFLHSTGSIFHILLNMYSLAIVGPILEQMLGRGRFVLLYLASAFGGAVAVLLLAPSTVVIGASGAVFGLFAAFFVVLRGLGANGTQLLVIIVLNLVIGFLPGVNISWQAHVGGLVVGAALGWIFQRTRGPRNRSRQAGLVAAVLVVLLACVVARFLI